MYPNHGRQHENPSFPTQARPARRGLETLQTDHYHSIKYRVHRASSRERAEVSRASLRIHCAWCSCRDGRPNWRLIGRRVFRRGKSSPIHNNKPAAKTTATATTSATASHPPKASASAPASAARPSLSLPLLGEAPSRIPAPCPSTLFFSLHPQNDQPQTLPDLARKGNS